jgi:hypothetical protein
MIKNTINSSKKNSFYSHAEDNSIISIKSFGDTNQKQLNSSHNQNQNECNKANINLKKFYKNKIH